MKADTSPPLKNRILCDPEHAVAWAEPKPVRLSRGPTSGGLSGAPPGPEPGLWNQGPELGVTALLLPSLWGANQTGFKKKEKITSYPSHISGWRMRPGQDVSQDAKQLGRRPTGSAALTDTRAPNPHNHLQTSQRGEFRRHWA